jgi:hypothetical protein
MVPYHNTVIVVGNLKESLLYYDHIIPLVPETVSVEGDIGDGQYTRIASFRSHFADDRLLSVLPPALVNNTEFLTEASGFSAFMGLEDINRLNNQSSNRSIVRSNLPSNFEIFSKKFDLIGIPIDAPNLLHITLTKSEPEPALSLTGINLVDVSSVSLDELFAFREDKESLRKMRRFRLFAYENYSGKERAFIEDDIQNRWSLYQEAVRKWGFENKEKSVSFLLESKPMLAAMVGGISSLITAFAGSEGAALAMLGAAGVTTLFEAGKLRLMLSKQHHALRQIGIEHPISYISDVQEALKPRP